MHFLKLSCRIIHCNLICWLVCYLHIMPQKWVIETINGPMVQMVRTLNGRKYSQNIYLKKNLYPEFIKKSLTTQEDNQLNNRFEHMLQK